ncbi:sigma-54-dependent Fis family transcriptional regulator [bacterium]|nr:sigma-54-dependent Fis family transcriptional regulator [bacterium]
MKLHILVVDDEPRIQSALNSLLQDEGYTVKTVESGEDCIQQVTKVIYDLVFLDVKLPGMNGLEVLKHIRKLSPSTVIIMMSGQSDLTTAVRATKLGAHNFLEKPLNPERVLIEADHVARQLFLQTRVEVLESMMDFDSEIIGDSVPIRRLKATIDKSAPTDSRILIMGENGTGKELIARDIHRQSRRRNGPFISLNCAAIPENLVESELFGHEKGAFTGADRKKPGRFEIADGGTLFLDEVGDMNPDVQAKLLRVLEEREAVRVGGNVPYSFDVRVIAATNKDLQQAIQQGRFREDLFYRLNVIPIHVPPLRDRLPDIPLLAHHFLKQICNQSGKGKKQWGEGCMAMLQSYVWPGNVRELRNFTERMVILSEGLMISAEEVSATLPVSVNISKINFSSEDDSNASFREQMETFEKQILSRGYFEAGGNVSEMARRLKIDRANLHRKLKSYGIK